MTIEINSETKKRVRQEQTIVAFKNYNSGLLAGCLGSWITASIFSDSWYFTLYWNIAYSAYVIFVIVYMNVKILRGGEAVQADIIYAKHVQTFFVAGIMLGVYAFWLIVNGSLEQKMVGLLYASIVVSLSVAGTSANFKAFLVYIVPIMVGVHLSSFMLLDSSNLFLFVAIGMPLFAAIVLYYGYTTNQSIRSHLLLRIIKEELSSKLSKEASINQNAREVAENAERSKTKFLAAASHDLRQPLQALHLFISAMNRDNLDDNQKNALEHVDVALSYMSEMLATLLDYSRIEAGVVTNHPEHLNLQPLLLRMVQTLGPLSDQKNLVMRLRDTKLSVYVDRMLLERILRNLISNAVRYTDEGGILINVRDRGDQVLIEVWDTGIGIAEDQLDEIFQEFVQMNNHERDGQKGLGLGLAIVQSICKLIGARIEVRSRIHHGSVFRLWLPKAANEKLTINVSIPESKSIDLSGLTLLVVDDNNEVANSIKTFVTTLGCYCFTADTAQNAEEIMLNKNIDVLLTDYRLREEETGGHVIERLRRVRPNLPAIIITGDTDPMRLRDAYKLGANILSKPVSKSELINELKIIGRIREKNINGIGCT